MKRIIAGLFSIVLLFTVAFSFAGCDAYKNKTYTMTSFGLYKVNGSEYNIKEYKDFFGITFADVQRIKIEYDIDIEDINSLKTYIAHHIGSSLSFGNDGSVVLTQNKCSNYKISSYETTTWTGVYSLDSESGLSILFPNYKLNNRGEKVKTFEGDYMTEHTAYLSSFAFGTSYSVSAEDDNTIVFTFLRGATEQSDRAVLRFTKQK